MKTTQSKFSLVVLCTEKTIDDFIVNKKYLELFINPKRIYVIASAKAGSLLREKNVDVEFVDEDMLLPHMTFQGVKKCIEKRTADIKAINRTGWYFQQFLKMAFSMSCQEESYLVWDADTIPTKTVEMYAADGKKIFDVKTEYYEPYFITMHHLFPELTKRNSYSFISEHMLFDTLIMRELINKIEQNTQIEGKNFWEKIINSVCLDDLSGSGFSEFETYGTYVEHHHKGQYVIRRWKSLREGTVFFKQPISEKELVYLSKAYDAISFEKHDAHKKLQKFFAHKMFQKLFIISIFEKTKEMCSEL